MRRIFTSFALVASLAVASVNASAQTCTGSAFVAGASYDFNTVAGGTMGFTGDFTRSGNALQSSNVGAGPTKVLTSPSFLAPNTLQNIQFSFDFGGNATLTNYIVEVLYDAPGPGNTAVQVCSGTTLNSGANFSFPAPAAVIGNRFAIRVTFTISGGTGQNITVDNFAINTPASQIGLPVKFSSFDAKVGSTGTNLIWNVATEENVAAYEVEKSNDGREFSTIGSVAAKNDPSYTFVDSKSSAAVSYYRVKAVDVDGKLTYSAILTVKGGRVAVTLKAFPMPAISNLTLQHEAAGMESMITISSAEGRTVQSIVPAKGAQQTTLNVSSLKAGVYVIRYKNGSDLTETIKIVKQ